MNDDYLWDKSGEPDPDVQRLEHALGPLRHSRPAPAWPVAVDRPARGLWEGWVPRFAAAAAALALVVGTWWAARAPQAAWTVERLEGAPRVGMAVVKDGGRLVVGQWLETDASSRARVEVGSIGEVQVEPNTRLRLLRARADEHRLALERGTMHAVIWAPPRLFFVETPSATAVDLGCAYTLTVDADGRGSLAVTAGWVAFDFAGHETVVPWDGRCETRPGQGPGTPYFEDAPAPLVEALARLDFARLAAGERAAAVEAVVTSARPRDAMTLWHRLTRGEPGERGRVFDRLAELAPPPAGVTRAGILEADREMLDRWWDEFGLGESASWRMYKARPAAGG
jgi:hypothetical protein